MPTAPSHTAPSRYGGRVSSKTAWQRWVVPSAAAVLLAAAAVAVAMQGPPTFSPPRFPLPDAELTAPTQGAPTASGTPEPDEAPHVVHLDLSWLAFALIAVGVVLVLALLWRHRRRRLRRQETLSVAELGADIAGDVPPAAEEPRPETVRRGLDRALDALDDPREPRGAIERAWLGLEEGAADSGVRRLAAETPGEFVTRVIARVAPERAAARALLEVYQRVRFGDGPVTTADVEVARDALAALRASWNAEAPVSRPGEQR